MAAIRLEIPPRLDHLAVVRLVVAAAAELSRTVPESRLDDLRLAVTEACSNAINAHRAEAGAHPVVIECELGPDRFQVDIRDQGPGFDPDELERLPPADDPKRLQHESGLGVPLIRVLTDGAEFIPHADGTTVRLVLDRR